MRALFLSLIALVATGCAEGHVYVNGRPLPMREVVEYKPGILSPTVVYHREGDGWVVYKYLPLPGPGPAGVSVEASINPAQLGAIIHEAQLRRVAPHGQCVAGDAACLQLGCVPNGPCNHAPPWLIWGGIFHR